jgi:hypothetical protein
LWKAGFEKLTHAAFFRCRPNPHEAGPRDRRRSKHNGMDRIPRRLLSHVESARAHGPSPHAQVAVESASTASARAQSCVCNGAASTGDSRVVLSVTYSVAGVLVLSDGFFHLIHPTVFSAYVRPLQQRVGKYERIWRARIASRRSGLPCSASIAVSLHLREILE